MIREKAGDGYRALGMSLLIHLAVFVFIAVTGLLTKPHELVHPPVEVVLYDVDGPGHGSGGGGGGGSRDTGSTASASAGYQRGERESAART